MRNKPLYRSALDVHLYPTLQLRALQFSVCLLVPLEHDELEDEVGRFRHDAQYRIPVVD